jgi:hypothetical protein
MSGGAVRADTIPAPMPDAPPLDVGLLRPYLAAGLTWLYETEQPEGAIMQHHGATMWAPEINRSVQLCPVAWSGLPVIVVEVARTVRRWPDASLASDRHYEIANGYTAGELERIVGLVQDLGRGVADFWNGHPGCASGSIALTDKAGPSAGPVHRYLAHCPTHDTVFCGHKGCTWYRDGRALVVPPTPPEAS